MSLPNINFLHLTVSEIQARTNFFPPPADPDTMGEKNTPTALKGFGVKAILKNSKNKLDRVSVPSPIAIDILMDTMARDRAHMYLFFFCKSQTVGNYFIYFKK